MNRRYLRFEESEELTSLPSSTEFHLYRFSFSNRNCKDTPEPYGDIVMSTNSRILQPRLDRRTLPYLFLITSNLDRKFSIEDLFEEIPAQNMRIPLGGELRRALSHLVSIDFFQKDSDERYNVSNNSQTKVEEFYFAVDQA